MRCTFVISSREGRFDGSEPAMPKLLKARPVELVSQFSMKLVELTPLSVCSS